MAVLERVRSYRTPSTQAVGLALALTATVVWSGNFVIARALHGAVPPVQTAFWRWIVALLAVAPFAWGQVRGEWPVIRRHLGFLALAALLGVTLFNTLIYTAGKTTSATNMAMIAAASPMMIALFDLVGARRGGREPLGARRVAGMVIALLGVLTLVGKGSPTAVLHLDFAVGDLWMLAATATFAGYSALLRRRPEGIGGRSFLFMTFALGAAMLVPAYAVSLAAEGGFPLTAGTVGPLLYIGVCSSAVAYFTWNKAIALVGAARAGVVYYLQPVCVALLSLAVLGEGIGAVQVLCMALIVAGVALGAAGTPR
ncbi:DMT family transporter [Streptomyces yunnanensis]|uniref:DMT family transporter n=1 Tax=Streptomyces yunnanensis TaxID=156453 RepID=A0ABY8AG29_9ACTN|nr:DMT family transporter [Streptomyces yunnanensis]WEB42572.1 DMT family transporter [Streptomyces yunnanensis]